MAVYKKGMDADAVSASGDKLNEMGRKARTNAETQKSTSGS